MLPRSTARPNPNEAIRIAPEEEISSTLSRHICIAHLESGAQQTHLSPSSSAPRAGGTKQLD